MKKVINCSIRLDHKKLERCDFTDKKLYLKS